MSDSDDTSATSPIRLDTAALGAILAEAETIFSAQPPHYEPADTADVEFVVAIGNEVCRRVYPLAEADDDWLAVLRVMLATLTALVPRANGTAPPAGRRRNASSRPAGC